MNVTNKLINEHQLIIKYISLLEGYLARLDVEINRENLFLKFGDFVDFIKNYADNYHHAKEENILFKYMEQPGVLNHCNPLPVMLNDHENGRHFVRELSQAILRNDYDNARLNAKGWAELLLEHIYKEDNILYVMAEEGLNDEQKNNITIEYKKVEKIMDGEHLEKKYNMLYARLEEAIHN
ncbi:MAG: hypothetical protein A2381_12760 [Bdellovibrionales bacterium RIFOXYB1_FULL_37_110]|nr:MAG: hypothetical protein A2181_02085 [Bdellovibrionales bacterium RIFOXYA1_FULL_38_20]OFZ51577.1 MAG: hypothetical protein A2417_12420 [Bdellovibrionales bacterium RIFOXYC1_FULL_37_79]OFZ60404.1 MAG: hypothetical protein A2381_12760 [Bdellovibrionales bacterium RIFOXYB1_FULL_37_110]OFZ64977.1 MAG: hypothetical protein A2577_09025 [Bdellovibrionales bacterium RIFOXYD1_FULL_36_51]